MGRSAGERVHQSADEEVAESANAELLLQRSKGAVEKLVRDAGYADALAGIRKGL